MGDWVSDKYQYFEYEFDSADAALSNQTGVASTDWPAFNITRPIDNVAAIKVLEVQIPNTYYLFTPENNTFTLYEDSAGAPTFTLVTIPVGNYDAALFPSVLQTALNTASAGLGNSNLYSVSYTLYTSKLVIAKTTNTIYAFRLEFGTVGDRGANNPRLWLGFNAGLIQSVLSGGNQVITAPNVFNFSGPNYLYLNSASLGPLIDLYLPDKALINSNGGLGPQMTKISVNVNTGGTIYWQDPDPMKWFDVEGLHTFSFADFYFTLGNLPTQQPLRFNGNPFSIKLGILASHNSFSPTPSGALVRGPRAGIVEKIRRIG